MADRVRYLDRRWHPGWKYVHGEWGHSFLAGRQDDRIKRTPETVFSPGYCRDFPDAVHRLIRENMQGILWTRMRLCWIRRTVPWQYLSPEQKFQYNKRWEPLNEKRGRGRPGTPVPRQPSRPPPAMPAKPMAAKSQPTARARGNTPPRPKGDPCTVSSGEAHEPRGRCHGASRRAS